MAVAAALVTSERRAESESGDDVQARRLRFKRPVDRRVYDRNERQALVSGSALGRWETAAWRTRSRGKEAYAAYAAHVLVPLPGRERAPQYDDVAHENLSRARMSKDQGRNKKRLRCQQNFSPRKLAGSVLASLFARRAIDAFHGMKR